MLNSDWDLLTFMIREKFPNARIVHQNYWEVYTGKGWSLPKNIANASLLYFDTLSDRRSSFKIIWLQPDKWVPRWVGPNRFGIFYLDDTPDSALHVFCPHHDGGFELSIGQIGTVFDRNEPEKIHFFDAVARMISKIGSNQLSMLDRNNGDILCKSQKTSVWVGENALAWLKKDSQRTIEGKFGPPIV